MTANQATAIITGGASGLGLACVQQLADRGYQVACCDRQAPSDPNTLPTRATYFPVDVTQTDSIVAMLQEIADWSPISILINCAGVSAAERVVGRDGAMPLDHFTDVVNTNLNGAFNMIRLVATEMTQQQPATNRVIINTASIAAFEGQLGQAAYSASKGAIVSMTLPLAREFKQFGIRVVTIAPGLMQTPMMAELSEKVQANLQAHWQYPDRYGQPDEFASLAMQVIENEYLNGCVLRLDGAVRLR